MANKRSYPFKKTTGGSVAKKAKTSTSRGWNPKTTFKQKMYASKTTGCKKYYKKKPRPNLFCRGVNSGNITEEMTIKNVVQMVGDISYAGTTPIYGTYIDYKTTSNKIGRMLGNNKENYKVFTRLDDYSQFYVKRITTVLDNFRVTRVYRADWLDAPSTTKRIYNEQVNQNLGDVEILYYRDKFGVGYPGAFADKSLGNWVELCEKKNFSSRKDSIYWTTKFNTKNERGLAPTSGLKTAMVATSSTLTKEDLFRLLGLKPKTEDKYKDIHSVNFIIGRYQPAPTSYFSDNVHQVSVKRSIVEYIQFDYTTYITIALTRAVS